jgi:large subunit ribosomal protein L21
VAAARTGASSEELREPVSELQQAIIRTGGKQYRVSPGSVLKVEKLAVAEGAAVDFEVLLVGQGDDVKIGTPLVTGAKVTGQVVSHGRGAKIIVYKFRKRTNYRKKQGHRQAYTEIKITGIQG